MDRQSFLKTSLGFAGSFAMITAEGGSDKKGLIPPYLKPGDLIGITAPAGWINMEDLLPAKSIIESWGFRVKIGTTIGLRDFSMAGSDEARLKDFQQMLDDDKVKAILCARGGYGIIRIIDQINFSRFRKNPKWIIGFSDVTVLHSHINHHFGIATIHSKMCNSFPVDWNNAEETQKESILSIRDAIIGRKTYYAFNPHPKNSTGKTRGLLIGGNLKVMESLSGTDSAPHTRNKILFLEDTGEYKYNIDRMFWNLKRSGRMEHLAGLIIGGFKIKEDDDPDAIFGKTLEEIILEKTKDCNYPVCFNFPVGHQKHNVALKCGFEYELNVQTDKCILQEI
jgi:muramoyltetrapeptide carboxypeptidase